MKVIFCCVPRRTCSVFQAGHFLCSKENISCVPITKNAHATFGRIWPIVPGFVRTVSRLAQILVRSAKFAKKLHGIFWNFERFRNREDSSDFDDFLTKCVTTTQIFFFTIFAPPKKNRVDEKLLRWRADERTKF